MNIGVICGRFAPLHIGHFNIIKKISDTQNFDKLVLLTSATQDSEKNPLSFEKKIKYIAASLGSINIEIFPKPMTNIYGAIKNIAFECQNSGGGTITLYCGSDRAEGYREMLSSLLPKYQSRGELLDVNLQVEEMSSRGDEGTYSATEMRDLVKHNKFEEFKAHCSPDLSDDLCLEMFMDIKRGMKLEEVRQRSTILKNDIHSWISPDKEDYNENEARISTEIKHGLEDKGYTASQAKKFWKNNKEFYLKNYEKLDSDDCWAKARDNDAEKEHQKNISRFQKTLDLENLIRCVIYELISNDSEIVEFINFQNDPKIKLFQYKLNIDGFLQDTNVNCILGKVSESNISGMKNLNKAGDNEKIIFFKKPTSNRINIATNTVNTLVRYLNNLESSLIQDLKKALKLEMFSYIDVYNILTKVGIHLSGAGIYTNGSKFYYSLKNEGNAFEDNIFEHPEILFLDEDFKKMKNGSLDLEKTLDYVFKNKKYWWKWTAEKLPKGKVKQIGKSKYYVLQCGAQKVSIRNKIDFEKFLKEGTVNQMPYNIADIIIYFKDNIGTYYLPFSLKKGNDTLGQIPITNINENNIKLLLNSKNKNKLLEQLILILSGCDKEVSLNKLLSVKGNKITNKVTTKSEILKTNSIFKEPINDNTLKNCFNKQVLFNIIKAGRRFGYLFKDENDSIKEYFLDEIQVLPTDETFKIENVVISEHERIKEQNINDPVSNNMTIYCSIVGEQVKYKLFIGSDRAKTEKKLFKVLKDSVLFNNILGIRLN